MNNGEGAGGATVLREADLAPLQARRVAVIGYGNQGRAHALNLRDSGVGVRVGLRAGSPNRAIAEADGFSVDDIATCAAWGDVVSLLLPDQAHAEVFDGAIAPVLGPGDALVVAHGFSVHFGQIEPPPAVDVVLAAPVGPGNMLRRLYLAGSGIPGLIAVGQDASGGADALALAYVGALGCARVGILRTTFAEETITDLFGEQAVLCGGIPALISAAFDTLVDAGYRPELAYFECVQQVKLLVDLIYERGIAGMREAISDTARFGSYDAGPRVVDGHVRAALRDLLAGIQDGSFARAWIAESTAGMPGWSAAQEQERHLPLEEVGKRLRQLARDEATDSN